jgi:hypothetical protein
MCVVLFKAELNLSASIIRRIVTLCPRARQVALGWLNPYIAGHYRLEVANDVFNGIEYVLSCRSGTSHLVHCMALC